MTRYRVFVDIELAVDAGDFQLATLDDDASGVSDVTDASVRDAVTRVLMGVDWMSHGLVPVRSIVTSRLANADGCSYDAVLIGADQGVG